MTHAIRIHKAGPASVLKWQKVDVETPKKGEVLIRNTAVGLNFIDTYHRKGLYPIPTPFTPGVEGAGVVEAIGAGVKTLKIGDRVAYCSDPLVHTPNEEFSRLSAPSKSPTESQTNKRRR